jgi:hypothetical protein
MKIFMIKDTVDRMLLREKPALHIIGYLIIATLHNVSLVFVISSLIITIWLLLSGEDQIWLSKLFALWVIAYFPLRFFKKILEKDATDGLRK